jgi:1-deoxy-D-xylulose-5-phosphate reductoisomerase
VPDDAVREVIVLGSTGSIGTQALDVVARNPARFRIAGLGAGGADPQLLAAQVRATRAPVVAVGDPAAAGAVSALVDPSVKVLSGPDAARELAGFPGDVVVNALPGSAGLPVTLAALGAGRTVALANKESLIVGGPLVTRLAAPGQLVPVDSEHSALAQCLLAGQRGEVAKLILTASGGPFRGRAAADLAAVTPADALAHPTWRMGPLVTVNSATLVNKGLEMIEAHLLFDISFDDIDVVVHPESIVHSLVEFTDGATLAQLSPPDMRLPIALALDWPRRVPGAIPAMSFAEARSLHFHPLDHDAFPAVRLAAAAGRAGGSAPCVFNAANEEAVAAFLAGALPFPAIVATIDDVLAEHTVQELPTVSDLLNVEEWARRRARERVEGRRC